MKVKIVDYKDAPSYEGYAEILDRMRDAINRKFDDIFERHEIQMMGNIASYRHALLLEVDKLQTEIEETLSGRLDAMAMEVLDE